MSKSRSLEISFIRNETENEVVIHTHISGRKSTLQDLTKHEIQTMFNILCDRVLHKLNFDIIDQKEIQGVIISRTNKADIEEQKIAKSIDGMQTAPGEKINEGNNPKSQFNENDIL